MMCYLSLSFFFHKSSYWFSTRFFAEMLWNHRTVLEDHKLLKRSRWGWWFPILWSLIPHPCTGRSLHLCQSQSSHRLVLPSGHLEAASCLNQGKKEHPSSALSSWLSLSAGESTESWTFWLHDVVLGLFLAGLFPKKAIWQLWQATRASQLICSAWIPTLPPKTSHEPQACLRQASAPQFHFQQSSQRLSWLR